jgi:hypothetical protein
VIATPGGLTGHILKRIADLIMGSFWRIADPEQQKRGCNFNRNSWGFYPGFLTVVFFWRHFFAVLVVICGCGVVAGGFGGFLAWRSCRRPLQRFSRVFARGVWFVSGGSAHEQSVCADEFVLPGTGGGHGEFDPSDTDPHQGADFQQFQPDRSAGGLRELGVGEANAA